MADHAVWVLAAHILWTFNLEREIDENGKEIIPDVNPLMFTSGGEASCVSRTSLSRQPTLHSLLCSRHPLPFKCKISVRPGAEEFLEDLELPGVHNVDD